MSGSGLSEEHHTFYQRIRKKVREWAKENGDKYEFSDYVLLAPDLFHLLCKLSADGDVPASKKAKLLGAIGYFVAPIDAVPEGVVGPAGYVDDVALSAHVLNDIINEVGEEVVQRHWAGGEDVLTVVQNILEMADEILGAGLWKEIKNAL